MQYETSRALGVFQGDLVLDNKEYTLYRIIFVVVTLCIQWGREDEKTSFLKKQIQGLKF